MYKRLFFLIGTLTIHFSGISQSAPIDAKATLATRHLYQQLWKLRQKGIMFGQQDALAYGVNWRYEEGRSDIKDVTGDHPAIYGWDLGGTEHNSPNDIDGVPFDKMKKWISEIYNRNGVNTISWHMDNPFTGKNAWDITPNSFASILPKGTKHDLYKKWLDNSIVFFNSIKGKDGKKVPILFRPFHELTGNWFWWCQNNGSPEEYCKLWKFTVDYLKNKGVEYAIENKVPFILCGMEINDILQKASDKHKQGFRQTARRFSNRIKCDEDIKEDIIKISADLGLNGHCSNWLAARVKNFEELKIIVTAAITENEKSGEEITVQLLTSLYHK